MDINLRRISDIRAVTVTIELSPEIYERQNHKSLHNFNLFTPLHTVPNELMAVSLRAGFLIYDYLKKKAIRGGLLAFSEPFQKGGKGK